MSTRSRGFANERRKITLPAKMPVAKPTAARNLRFIVHLLSRRSLRLRRRGVGVPQAALQVVEDEADRGRRTRRSSDPPRVVADDEHAAVGGRGLELRDRALGAERTRALQQLSGGPRAPRRRLDGGAGRAAP